MVIYGGVEGSLFEECNNPVRRSVSSAQACCANTRTVMVESAVSRIKFRRVILTTRRTKHVHLRRKMQAEVQVHSYRLFMLPLDLSTMQNCRSQGPLGNRGNVSQRIRRGGRPNQFSSCLQEQLSQVCHLATVALKMAGLRDPARLKLDRSTI